MNISNTKLLRKAFKIIRRNYGCPGNDGISISDIRRNYESYALRQLHQLESGYFQFEPNPKKTKILDYLGKEREIYVYCVPERWTQEFLKLKIAPFVESVLSQSVFGYRQNKSDTDSYIHILRNNPRYVVRIDIDNFFGQIDKETIFRKLKIVSIPNDLICAVRRSLRHCSVGLPQGNVLSCMLSNLSLASFDELFLEDYTRYGDDMMFACISREEAHRRIEYATTHLRKRGFLINKLKIQILFNPTFKDFL